ncbi:MULTISPECIES: dienelactone hydrolase family protein [Paenibacillus]|uniref:alpha/beta hydrolase family protein n=1 Tax=Paenibacillus TaxID=44249 RepID=UPI00249ACBB9|nr:MULTISPECIES: dienelactone hydrolase family protein [Paenibacillus]WFA87641.1 dienelactone hydrolase family protein [Paenibacillus amylolyticus]
MNVGRNVVVLNDKSRKDPFSNDEERAIITSIYYPTDDKNTQINVSNYMDLFDPSKDKAINILKDLGVDIEYLNTIETHIYNNYNPKYSNAKSDVILYSPGFGVSRDMYTYHIKYLVDCGYIVVSIGATYESVFSIFPDGRVVNQTAQLTNIKSTDFILWRELLDTRVEDILYVINHLDLLFSQSLLEGFSYRSIGIVGHSLGGAAAFEVAKRDNRIRAGVMFDASFHLLDLEKNEKIDTPFLIMRQEKCTYDELLTELSEGIINPFISGFEKLYKQLNGYKAAVKVQGAHHMTFSDVPIHFKDIEAINKHEIISDYSTAFLSEFIQGKSYSLQNSFNHKRSADIVEINIKGQTVSV